MNWKRNTKYILCSLIAILGAFNAFAQIDLYLSEVIEEEPNYASLEKQPQKQVLTYEWTQNKVVNTPFVFSKKLYFAPTGDQWICYKWESYRPIYELEATLTEMSQTFMRKEDYTWVDTERKIAYTISILNELGAFTLTAYAYSEE